MTQAVIVILVIAAGIFFAPAFVIRMLARIPWYWTFTPANTFSIGVTEKNDMENVERGGNIVNVFHSVPGKQLVKIGDDPMKWYFKVGTDPEHENFLYQHLGVQSMGSVFYTLRNNVDKRDRYARSDKGLETVTKKRSSQYVFYTGELEVAVTGADTVDRIPLNFKINFVFERKFPVRSVLRLADAPAFLGSQIEEIVNRETSSRALDDYYGGKDANENRKKLGELIGSKLIKGTTQDEKNFKKIVEQELGLIITTVAIHDVDVDKDYKASLTSAGEMKKKMEAEKERVRQESENIRTKAQAEADAIKMKNDADADRIERVIKPAAENERTVAIRLAEAYENNQTVTTFAPGKDSIISLGK